MQSSDGETEAQREDGSVSRSQNKSEVEIRLELSYLTSDTASTALIAAATVLSWVISLAVCSLLLMIYQI